MFNDTDSVGFAFKRAFYRVDGVTMYIGWGIWLGVFIWSVFDREASKMEVVLKLVIGLIGPFFYVMFGLMRLPGLLSAIVIAATNIMFISAFF